MSWSTFGKAVLLIIIFALANTTVKCMHDMKCSGCKVQPQAVAVAQ